MYLRTKKRLKNGKQHVYYSVVESHRAPDGSPVQRELLYLGEINASQEAAWQHFLQVWDAKTGQAQTVSLFPDTISRSENISTYELNALRLRMDQITLQRPRAFGDCFVACKIWEQLGLEGFWKQRLEEPHRGKAPWHKILQLLAVNRMVDPGSEWRIHRQWMERSAMDELLSIETGHISKDRLYRCLDRILEYREELFGHLRQKWTDLFSASFDVLLYDLTSTYFEGSAKGIPKAVHGYSRDGRPDCRQVVVALVVTTDGLPMAYEIMPGNTSDKTTLEGFLEKIEKQYGKARRTWLMDRGIPTEKTLKAMRERDIHYLVGTPRGQLGAVARKLINQPWVEARQEVEVKLLSEQAELLVLARSVGRKKKERAIRRKKLTGLLKGLAELRVGLPDRDKLLQRIGALKHKAGRAARFVQIKLPTKDQAVTGTNFSYQLDWKKYKQAARLDGHYLLRTNLTGEQPESLWNMYMQLTRVEAAFKSLKSDLAIRPIHHYVEPRVEAHIFVAFLGYCLTATLQMRLRAHAPGLTPRAVLEKLATIQLIDVHIPVVDSRHLVMRRYTQPDKTQALLLERMALRLPEQPPPKIYQNRAAAGGVSLAPPSDKSRLAEAAL